MKFFSFLQESDGLYSWGRVIGSVTMLTASFLAYYIVMKTNAIDIGTLSALAAFGVSPFATSKGIAAAAKPTAGQ